MPCLLLTKSACILPQLLRSKYTTFSFFTRNNKFRKFQDKFIDAFEIQLVIVFGERVSSNLLTNGWDQSSKAMAEVKEEELKD